MLIRHAVPAILFVALTAAGGAQETPATPKWSVKGRVVDADGNPMPGVMVRVSTGIGSLRTGGQGTTNEDGRYEFPFGPGIMFAGDDVQLQFATVSANKTGYFEANLGRQGNLAMARKLPEKLDGWAGMKPEDIILPGKPRELNFQLLPAARCGGVVIDEDGKPLSGYGVSLKGKDMPPSSSVAEHAKTDEQGRFLMKSIPTGFDYQILVQPAKREWPWNAWASGPVSFHAAEPDQAAALTRKEKRYEASEFEIQVKTAGVNWKRALEIGGDHDVFELAHGSSRLRLTLDPPGLPVADTILPESIDVSIHRLQEDDSFDPSLAFEDSISLEDRRGLVTLPEAALPLDFARVKSVSTKLSSSYEVRLDTEMIGDEDPDRRLLVYLRAFDEEGDKSHENWRVVSGGRMRAIEIPRVTLAKVRQIRLGVRELSASEIQRYPETKSRTNLRRTQPDGEGQFTIRFENPADGYSGGRQSLDPEKHQVIFQVFAAGADGKTRQKIFRQLPAKERGGYDQRVTVKPEWLDHSRVSITFVTIQPQHDQWVKKFFHRGEGTSYKGMWIGDSAPLGKMVLAR